MISSLDFIEEELLYIAELFVGKSNIKSMTLISQGSINLTYLVSKYSDPQERIILQCINTSVFTKPNDIMLNLKILLDHCSQKLDLAAFSMNGRRWVIPEIVSTLDGNQMLYKFKSTHWRAFKYISSTVSFSSISDPRLAYECGFALSYFHSLVKDINPNLIHQTLEDFHSIAKYISKYDLIIRDLDNLKYSKQIRSRIDNLVETISSQANFISNCSEKAFHSQLITQVIHGDPKISNLLFDKGSSLAISLIDLDTVGIGFLQYDIADCLRSICNKAGEEPESISTVSFDLDLFGQMLKGYDFASSHISISQIKLIPQCLKLLTLELAIRFLIDFLEGNKYFKVSEPYQNLYKAEVQITLFNCIDKLYNSMFDEINTLFP